MGSGERPAAPPITEPIAVADAVANGVTVWEDGTLTWLTFWAERRTGDCFERIVTSRVCVPSSQYPALLRMMSVPARVTYERSEDGYGVN